MAEEIVEGLVPLQLFTRVGPPPSGSLFSATFSLSSDSTGKLNTTSRLSVLSVWPRRCSHAVCGVGSSRATVGPALRCPAA